MTFTEGIEDQAALEDAFGIPRGYINNLHKEDDWSLIIKSHALLESACADMLCNYFGNPSLAEVFAQLEMSNKRSGKAAFISALGLLNSKERRFISELSELRNLVVHNASNVTFSLKSYLEGLTEKKRANLIEALNLRVESAEFSGQVIKPEVIAISQPSLLIWFSLTSCLSTIHMRDIFAIKRNELIAEKMAEEKKKGPIHISSADAPLSINPRKQV